MCFSCKTSANLLEWYELSDPAGWQVEAKTIDAPLVIEPVGGGNGCYYNILRDNLLQSCHQYVFAGPQWP